MKLNERRLRELQKHLEAHGYQAHLDGEDFLCIHTEGMPIAAYQLDPDSAEGVLHLDVAGAIARDAAVLAIICTKLGATVLGEDMYLDGEGSVYFGQEAWDRYEVEIERRSQQDNES
jgi:hypothetical protein